MYLLEGSSCNRVKRQCDAEFWVDSDNNCQLCSEHLIVALNIESIASCNFYRAYLFVRDQVAIFTSVSSLVPILIYESQLFSRGFG